MNKLQQSAFKVLETIEKNTKEEHKINTQLRKGNYELEIKFTEGWFLDDVVRMLDEIIGDKWASWYLYEKPKIGIIKDGKKTYKIRNINDLKKYYEGLHN